MDDATTRRSVESVNAEWGNLRAILAGDYLLGRAWNWHPTLAPKSPACSPPITVCEGPDPRTGRPTTRPAPSGAGARSQQDGIAPATACRIPHHRRTASPGCRIAHRVRPRLRHGLPGRRRRLDAVYRRRTRKACRQRPPRGHLHASRDPRPLPKNYIAANSDRFGQGITADERPCVISSGRATASVPPSTSPRPGGDKAAGTLTDLPAARRLGPSSSGADLIERTRTELNRRPCAGGATRYSSSPSGGSVDGFALAANRFGRRRRTGPRRESWWCP